MAKPQKLISGCMYKGKSYKTGDDVPEGLDLSKHPHLVAQPEAEPEAKPEPAPEKDAPKKGK